MDSHLKLPEQSVTAVVLGIMQDGGLPHIGCRCYRCKTAFAGAGVTHLTTCLGIVDNRRLPVKVWLIDATPDIKFQLEMLGDFMGDLPHKPGRLRQPDGIFLTHSHMGHTAGLAQLGPEGMNVQNLPLYASTKLCKRIQKMRLWQPLVNNLNFYPLAPERPLELAPELKITPIPVQHRDEISAGTFAYLCSGPGHSLFYLPDIDSWKSFEKTMVTLDELDFALVDGSFFSRDEVGGRQDIAHPLVPETIKYWSETPAQIMLIHINHTNPILDQGSEERRAVEAAGFSVAFTGQILPL